MREIRFRGKMTHNNEWAFGDLNQDRTEGKVYMQGSSSETMGGISNTLWDVYPHTIGQFTGLKDKNGFDIFEGDIVRILYTDWGSEDDFMTGEVVFEDSQWGVLNKESNRYGDYVSSSINPGTHGWIELIGNIHDNLKL